ncbi:DUF1838 family protein [Altererythrobacter arenosus]|uniref:DUF1838 family protein n=1 Tax=Altererythrobacter arenosus TaxID=3032592 RepID=A0ABY8FMS7_9SPHN|nr:DUF1838 family protein [Altererythrobacter sp. CAU 1644]WFL76334.1 DUF1838 family protein [Altererythrobacter sp. CAU 1644]
MIGHLTKLAAATALLAAPAMAEELDPANADDAFRMNTKMFCSLETEDPTVYYWEGTVYSVIRGEKDRHLFNVIAMNTRQCEAFEDPVRGVGSRSVSREVMFYLDPESGEILRTWNNPWTGETVDVVHVANDPVNSRRPSWSRDEQGQPNSTFDPIVMGDHAYRGGGAALLFYDNPLAGDYQEYVGNNYQAAEFLTWTAPLADIKDAGTPHVVDSVISWGRISRWIPWMKMGGREGVLVFYTGGLRLNSWDEMPDKIKDEIKANYPAYVAPPPVNDDRPNDTSWTVAKRIIDAARAAEDAADGGETE